MTTTLTDLVADLRKLPKLDPIGRAREAERLGPLLRSALSVERNAAIEEATRDRRYEDVAEALGKSYDAVDRAVQEARRARRRPVSQ